MQATHADTIVATSSPPGRSPRGLIRISGPGTVAILKRLLEEQSAEPRIIAPVRLRQPSLPALLLRFIGPASYTGENAAELQLPGNPALLDRVVQQIIATPDANARLAEPGEFTFRAYTAGKLDLTQAEGVGATITAVSDSQLAAAGLLRRGRLGQTAESLVEQLGNLLALVEAGIDFTDQEDVTPIASQVLQAKVGELTRALDSLLARSRSWNAIEALPRVVLVGPPSAGKSTLFNALLGKERAVIDHTPGTTRDALTEPLQLTDPDGRTVEAMLVDLAGLDESLNELARAPDRDAQRIAQAAIHQADLLLRISDDPQHFIELTTNAPTLDIQTKTDQQNSLHPNVGVQPTNNPNPHLAAGAEDAVVDTSKILRVSAHTGEGLDTLRAAIVHGLADKAVSLHADLLALQPRHEQALRDAVNALQQTRDLLASAENDRLPAIELLADAMRAALDALASLGGRLTPDEVIGRVFATFCVGK